MPILDCEPYHQENTAYILKKFSEYFREKGIEEDRLLIFHFNIFLGRKHFKRVEDWDTFDIARELTSCLAWLVIHPVPRGEVLKTKSDFVASQMDDCITVFWAALEPRQSDIDEAISFADDVIKKFELIRGIPCPIPLALPQLMRSFELGVFSKRDGANWTIPVEYGGDWATPLDQHSKAAQLFFQGNLDELEPKFREGGYGVHRMASEWQQRAIRSIGLEDWPNVVISTNTWVEVFAVQMTKLIQDKLDEPIDNVRAALSPGLPKFIAKYLGGLCGGSGWDYKNSGSDFAKWRSDCYLLRHQVVHEGHIPSEQEAQNAYTSASGFMHWLTRKLAALEKEELDELLEIPRGMSQLQNSRSDANASS